MTKLYGASAPAIGRPYQGKTAGLYIEQVTTPVVESTRLIAEKTAPNGRRFKLFAFKAGKSVFQAAVPA